jgi:threonyl-tRNA synthetase
MLVVGGREEEAGTVAVREHGSGEQDVVDADAFVDRITHEIRSGMQREDA